MGIRVDFDDEYCDFMKNLWAFDDDWFVIRTSVKVTEDRLPLIRHKEFRMCVKWDKGLCEIFIEKKRKDGHWIVDDELEFSYIKDKLYNYRRFTRLINEMLMVNYIEREDFWAD